MKHKASGVTPEQSSVEDLAAGRAGVDLGVDGTVPPCGGRWLLALAMAIALWAGTRGIAREGAFFVPGDAPRYAMNGVFLHDALRAGVIWTPGEWARFGQHYYAQYPALSLGHHPPMLPALLVPFYLVFGVSMVSARLAMLTAFLLAVWLFGRVAQGYYDDEVGGWTAVLVASSPAVGTAACVVMSEMPTFAFVAAALLCVERFRASGRMAPYLGLVAAAAGSLLTRPTALYMFPAYAVLLLRQGGWHRLTRGRLAVINGVAAVGGVLMVIGYMTMSPANGGLVLAVLADGFNPDAIRAVGLAAIRERPLAVAAGIGIALAAFVRDWRVAAPLAWAASVLTCTTLLTGAIEPERYSMLALPALCVLGASAASTARGRAAGMAVRCVLLAVVGLQVVRTAQLSTRDTPGYEAAAQYVIDHTPGRTVLYSAAADTGYFVFFVRKHDPARQLVVLRSDKLLTTSRMAALSVEVLIARPEDIYGLLRRYGTRLVVIEDQPSGDPTLEWLRTLVKTGRFAERQRLAIGPRFPGVDLAIYEYLDATPADPDAELDLNLPLVDRRITVRLSELGRPAKAR